ncbi:hypothetical protein [Paenibacillus agri]|uniref:Uncharacterized protein n=1 Tax=Paenibacillus agri TaxID=2744309 RepID=A0A850EL16_9BACL|nr:hypothetical protein [Paenibacillus agri]NUU61708.1 hypothetical protein [Paenibacillus agri]
MRQAGPVDLDGAAGQGRTGRKPGGPAHAVKVWTAAFSELRVLQQQDTQSVDAVCVLLHQPAEGGLGGAG